MALVKATTRFRSGNIDPNIFLIKLIPITNSSENKGIKEGGSKSSGWKLNLFSMYFWNTDTVPGLEFNPAMPAWWKFRASMCLLRVGW